MKGRNVRNHESIRTSRSTARPRHPPELGCRPLEHRSGPVYGDSGVSPSVSPATWKERVDGPPEPLQTLSIRRSPAPGTASVAFTIARSGQVLSAHLIGSSGNPALDAEAVSLPRRASPVPPPPSEFGGSVLTLTVPIHFGG